MNEPTANRQGAPDDLEALAGCAGIINVVFNACCFVTGFVIGAVLVMALP